MRRAPGTLTVADESAASADGPSRKRASWSLKTIVEDVAGRPMEDLQEPGRPVHPYLRLKGGTGSGEGPVVATHETRAGHEAPSEETPDPIEHIYPPLIGAAGRSYHGKDAEHHHETLHSVSPPPGAAEPGVRPHAPGPSRRPERIYLHYLLLHMDRLSDAALGYLKHAVDEEVAHRERPVAGSTPAVREPPAPPPSSAP
jgi:hypothetical protein